jgi:hypothetical protein
VDKQYMQIDWFSSSDFGDFETLVCPDAIPDLRSPNYCRRFSKWLLTNVASVVRYMHVIRAN